MAKKASPTDIIRNRVKELRMVKASELSPHPQNWRRHPSFQRGVMQDILSEIGFAGAVIARETPDGLQIIDGHLRAEVGGNTPIPVLVLDVDEAEAKKLLATFDPIGALAQPDNDVLSGLLTEVNFGSQQINDMLADLVGNLPAKQGLIDDDDIPEQVETICKTGDLWQLGEHRLLNGDSTKREDVERLMGEEKADMVFTDPPYGIDLDTDWSGVKGSKKSPGWIQEHFNGGGKYAKVIGDNKAFQFKNFAYLDCKEQFWCGADYYHLELPNSGSWFVWDKRLEENADLMIGNCFELIWSRNKHKKEFIRRKWAGVFGLAGEDSIRRIHPTQKPTDLINFFISKFSKDTDVILDPFGGSGSTLIACEKLGRKCFMMEIDEHYCDVIIQRWQEFTGNKAVKL